MPTLSGAKEGPGLLSPGQDSRKRYDYISPAMGLTPALQKLARLLLIVSLLGPSVLGGTGLPAYAAARNELNCNPWSLIPGPKSGTNGNELDGVAVVSAGDVWAVGNYFNSTLNSSQTLVEHWNGSKWQVVPSPNASTGFSGLTGVAADLSGSVWAVGESTNPAQGNNQTLVEHWNGSKWQIVSSPNASSSDNGLNGVAADLSGGLWAVGGYFDTTYSHEQTLIERWHSGTWQMASSPNTGTGDNDLNGVAVEFSGNAWAVGSYFDPRFGSFRTLIERWDGSRWSVISSPNIGRSDNRLTGVTVDLSGNAWAAGEYFNRILGSFQTLIEHWDGSSWQVVPSLDVGTGDNRLNDVTTDISGNAWAVGNYTDPNNLFQTLVEHWDGISWQVVPSANPGTGNSLLLGVDVGGIFSPARVVNRVWAVGYSGNQTLIEASPNQVACS